MALRVVASSRAFVYGRRATTLLVPQRAAAPCVAYGTGATATAALGHFGTTRRFRSSSSAVGEEEVDDGFGHVDVLGGLQAEVQAVSSDNVREQLIAAWLPRNAPAAATNALREYLGRRPVDEMIGDDSVVVTHIQEDDGRDGKATGLSKMTVAEAVRLAKDQGMQLVRLGGGHGTAYCRIRREREAAMAAISKYLPEAPADMATGGASLPRRPPDGSKPVVAPTTGGDARYPPLRDTIVVTFRDVSEAHFMNWRSEKCAKDLKKRHPHRLSIEKFGSVPGAVRAMRAFLEALKGKAETHEAPHHYTGIIATEREFAVLISPPTGKVPPPGSKLVLKHPGEEDWARALAKLQKATGGKGTTADTSKMLRKQNIGATTFRKDRYGRRVE